VNDLKSGVINLKVYDRKNAMPYWQGFAMRRFLHDYFDHDEIAMIVYEKPQRMLSIAAMHIFGVLEYEIIRYAEHLKIPYIHVEPTKVKKWATGSGVAKKDAMIAAAQKLYPDVTIADDNHADALLILGFYEGTEAYHNHA
jgi:Holliday junction resolvasome RuvABC endonuclease subunit